MDRIELLSERLIEENPYLAMDILAASSNLGLVLGWHYILDLIWILKNAEIKEGFTVLDAGGGNGLLQFIIADMVAPNGKVISVDMSKREHLPLSIIENYNIKHIENKRHVSHDHVAKGINLSFIKRQFLKFKENFKKAPQKALSYSYKKRPTVYYYRSNLKRMRKLKDNSVDLIVSVSALEHNPPDNTALCVKELQRVLKKNGKMLMTVSACKESNGREIIHKESRSWMMDEKDLIKTYDLQENCESNFSEYDRTYSELCTSSTYLKKWLAPFYYQDNKNGMPKGIWKPQYQPVAILKENNK